MGFPSTSGLGDCDNIAKNIAKIKNKTTAPLINILFSTTKLLLT